VEFLLDYGSFLLKSITIVGAVCLILVAIGQVRDSLSSSVDGELQITKLNDVLDAMRQTIEHAILPANEFKKQLKEQEKAKKKEQKEGINKKNHVFVLDFDGDIKASAADNLRHEISAILEIAKPEDEVVVRLESSGGMVHSYGFAASQLSRIREAQIPLTICVDKVAASGGYMMACIGNQILAAPFAILGSIGVVAQLPNFHRLLKKHDVDFEMHTAGQYKRTLTIFGENTDESRSKFQQDLEIVHQQFKSFVANYRPQLDIEAVATGETWLGIDAKNNNLVDIIITSDAYLLKRSKEAQLLQVSYVKKKKLVERLGLSVGGALEKAGINLFNKLQNSKELI